MTTLFISDLHLDATRPATTALFLEFLQKQAVQADALYILGDLFEAWLGDDDPAEVGVSVASALHGLTAGGVPVFFMHGNRDFLLGNEYAKRAGMQLLPDPTVVDLYGKPVLLMHGDLLCTDDVPYQAFRAQSRKPEWQAQMLAQPLPVRQALAQQARQASYARQSELKEGDRAQFEVITDASSVAIEETFVRYGVDTLIHGHTHRPAIHELSIDNRACKRIVLGDWYEQGSVLRVDASGFKLEGL